MSFDGNFLKIGRGGMYDGTTVDQLAEHSYKSPVDTLADMEAIGYFPAYLGTDEDTVIIGDIVTLEDNQFNSKRYTLAFPDPVTLVSTGEEGNVDGPASSTDNAITRFNGTSGQLIQNSNAILDDLGNVTFQGTVTTDSISELTPLHGIYTNGDILFSSPTPTIGTLGADSISIGPGITTLVEIKRTYFTASGNDPYLKVGSSAANTNNATVHLQARADANFFVEADTNGAGANDIPIMIATGEMNQAMGRLTLDKVSNTLVMDTGSANTLGSDVNMSFRTGGDYVTAPATGTPPNYQGGGATAPIEAMKISGSDQAVTFYAGVYLDTITNDDTQTQLLVRNSSTKQIQYRNFATTGDVDGPASSTDEAIARFDGATGKLIQNSTATIDDFGNAIFAGDMSIGSDLLIDYIQEKTPSQGIAFSSDVSMGSGSSPAASAILDLVSTTKGFLPPRMTTAQRTAIVSPATGLIVYDTDDNQWYGYNGSIWAILG